MAAFWLLGSAAVALAQPDTNRRVAAAAAAVAGIATILVVSRLTHDPDRRYFRSLIGAMVAVSVTGDWVVQHLAGSASGFVQYGFDTRIALPLLFVLLTPLIVRALPTRLRSRALWRERALIVREARPFDWLAAAYALLIVPGLLLGLAHHAPKSFVLQDLGLIVFFVFAYVAGRTVSVRAGRELAFELVVVLLLLGLAQAFLGWDTTPIFTFAEAACVGAIGFALLKPTRATLLALALALALLANDAVAIANGAGSTTAVELAAALGTALYLVVRVRGLLPQWLLVAIVAAALAGFVAFTADGVTIRGEYQGVDQSQLGRTFEAQQVREAIHGSPVSLAFGRGLGGNIDESHAPRLFRESLVYGGRDLAHVQQVHLLPYAFLLKNGIVGFAWLAALVVGIAILGIRALEIAARDRDPTPVVYAALPLLGVAAALAAATHLQDNPLNAFAVGVLATRLGRQAPVRLRLGVAVAAAAVVAAAAGAVAYSGRVPTFVYPEFAGGPSGANAVVVGHLRFNYPLKFHQRRFATTNKAVTGVRHGGRAHGVVVASYPLERHPELHGSGERFRPNGVFFELYQAPYQSPRLQQPPAPVRAFPLTIFDLPDIPGLPPAREQGGTAFRVRGRNYSVILWVGPHAPTKAQLAAEQIVSTLRHVSVSRHERARPHKHPRRHR